MNALHEQPLIEPDTEFWNGVALSLGSGFLGFSAHCGFLAEWDACGLTPPRLAGASAGAYAGLLYASGLRGEESVAFVMQPGMKRSFLDASILWRAPGIATWTYGTGVFTGNRAVKYLKRALGEHALEDLHNPTLDIAVTDLKSGQSLIVNEGDAVEYTVASCCVPGLFQARRIGDRLLWDGGLANDLPFIHWLDNPDIHTIVIHSLAHEEGSLPVPRWPNMAHGVAVGHQLVSNLLTDYRKQLAELHGKRLIHIVTKAPHPGWKKHRIEELAVAGRESGIEAISILKKVMNEKRAE